MANEAVIIELLGNAGDPVRFNCASNVTISAGTICYLVDPRTASASHVTLDGVTPAGIAAHDKISTDGSTSITCYTNGIFDLTAAGTAITAGHPVSISGTNLISGAALITNAGRILGIALETASASEVIAVRVKV